MAKIHSDTRQPVTFYVYIFIFVSKKYQINDQLDATTSQLQFFLCLQSLWSCSVCRRKQQSIQQLIVAQDSTDSLLDIPILDTLQRRHSDLKISSKTNSNMQSLGSGLAPPRSPELRRHSDVSPASLKELEKVSICPQVSDAKAIAIVSAVDL